LFRSVDETRLCSRCAPCVRVIYQAQSSTQNKSRSRNGSERQSAGFAQFHTAGSFHTSPGRGHASTTHRSADVIDALPAAAAADFTAYRTGVFLCIWSARSQSGESSLIRYCVQLMQRHYYSVKSICITLITSSFSLNCVILLLMMPIGGQC